MMDNLVNLNLPHPNGIAREMVSNTDQPENSNHARTFIEGSPIRARHLF